MWCVGLFLDLVWFAWLTVFVSLSWVGLFCYMLRLLLCLLICVLCYASLYLGYLFVWGLVRVISFRGVCWQTVWALLGGRLTPIDFVWSVVFCYDYFGLFNVLWLLFAYGSLLIGWGVWLSWCWVGLLVCAVVWFCFVWTVVWFTCFNSSILG